MSESAFEAELLKAIKPLASSAADARLDAAEREIERLFPKGGFAICYLGDRIWQVRCREKWLSAMGLAHALRAAHELKETR